MLVVFTPLFFVNCTTVKGGDIIKHKRDKRKEKEVVSLKIVLQRGQTWTADQNPVVAFVELRKCDHWM